MRKYLLFCLTLLALPLGAEALPDNMYFRAMHDEMQRTRKELRMKGGARPYFAAYKVIFSTTQSFTAQFGVPYAAPKQAQSGLEAMAYVYAGNAKNNSSGFVNNVYYYRPATSLSVPVSYDGLRRILWRLTDNAYAAAGDSYEKKMAYKRQKNLTDDQPDFSAASRAFYVRDITQFEPLDEQYGQKLVQELSAMGKETAYLESFSASLQISQQDIYFLDSENDFYQYSQPLCSLTLTAALRTKEGYQENQTEYTPFLCGQMPSVEQWRSKTREFLARLDSMYQAKKAEPYLGPVLLEAEAAGGFFNQLFVRNVNNPKPLLSAQDETDASTGQFKDKRGLRVISPFFDVYDRPQLKQYQGEPLTAFTPLDDEGVQAQQLQLVQSGKLLTLPAARSLIEGQKQSNGHARMNRWTYPRAALTNVFFVPQKTLSSSQLEQKLLERCRELGLEYGYIFPYFPVISSGKGELNFAWRIYAKDGRREPVYGLRLENMTTRSLRDILAAGENMKVSEFSSSSFLPVAVAAPSILVDEIEILPTQRKPDRAPFVPLP